MLKQRTAAFLIMLCCLATASAGAQTPAKVVVSYQVPPQLAPPDPVAAQSPLEYQLPPADAATEASQTPHELSSVQAAAINYAYGGEYAYRGADHCRAGCPELIRKHAIPSNTRHYGGYYVGGGVPIHGEGPYYGDGTDEGTFGWDYFGIAFPKRVVLNWTHGRRYQGGGGVYKTDGPKLKHE